MQQRAWLSANASEWQAHFPPTPTQPFLTSAQRPPPTPPTVPRAKMYMQFTLGCMVTQYVWDTYLDLRQHSKLRETTRPGAITAIVTQDKFDKVDSTCGQRARTRARMRTNTHARKGPSLWSRQEFL